MSKQKNEIKELLETLYARYNHRDCIKPDPLQFVYRYSDRPDMEIAALLAAVLAYGRVAHIQKSLNDLFKLMDNKPFDFVRNFDKNKRKKLAPFKHRFTTGDNISDLLELLRLVLIEHDSIERFFLAGYSNDDPNIIPALSKFCDSLIRTHTAVSGKEPSRGLGYLLVRPADRSACKRLNLFLRWMVRDDEVDPGLWKSVDKSKLIVPIDVHMGRLSRILGFSPQKTVSLSTALKITENFAKIVPDDPVKYDFALSRIGIVESCTGQLTDKCQICQLYDYCAPIRPDKAAKTATYT